MSKDDKKRYLILKDPNIVKGLAILAFPLMLNNFLRTFHDLIDSFFVGLIPDVGDAAIGAISISFPVTFFYISFGMGLSIAGTALISQFYGANQIEQARKYASQLVVIALILGIIFMFISFFFAPSIMQLMGTEGYIYEQSSLYLKIRAFELPVLFVFFAFTSIRQSSGDTITPVVLGVIAMIVNMILSPLLISVFNLGVPGAAYATLFANIVIMPYGIVLLFRSKNGITIKKEYLTINPRISRKIINTAIPASVGQAFTAIGFVVLNSFINSYGQPTLSAFSIGNRISSIFLHPVMAIGGVMAAYIGQNIGNLNPDRAKKAFHQGLLLSMVIMAIGSFIGMVIRKPMAELFLDPGMSLELAVTYMFYLFLGLPLMAIYQSYTGAFNGTGNTQYTFWLGVIRLWMIRIPLILLLKNYSNLGSSGIWYAMLASNFIIAIIGYFMMIRVDFKPKVDLDPVLE